MVVAAADLDSVAKKLAQTTIHDVKSVRADVRRLCEGLRAQYPYRKVPLVVLDTALKNFKNDKGISKNMLKNCLRGMGICTGNCQVLGSNSELKKYLHSNPQWKSSLKRVKKFEFVKLCLVGIFRRR